MMSKVELNRSAIILCAPPRARSRHLGTGWLRRSTKLTLPQCRHPADNATVRPAHAGIVAELSKLLHAGWKAALPRER